MAFQKTQMSFGIFAQCPNIEEVILSHCTKLVQVYSSSFLCKLKCLWLNGCISLRSLQITSNILLITSGLIVFHGCSSLDMLVVGNEKKRVQRAAPYDINMFRTKCLKEDIKRVEKKKGKYTNKVPFWEGTKR